MQERQKALLREIIERVNELFEGELTEDNKLVYVNNVIKGKLLESHTLSSRPRTTQRNDSLTRLASIAN